MKDSIHKYFKIGTVLWMSFPGEDSLTALRRIGGDSFFDGVEVCSFPEGKREEAARVLEESGLRAWFGAQPALLGGGLNPNALQEEDRLAAERALLQAVDEAAARELARIAGLDIESYAMEMFSAGSNLKDKTDEEIFYQDFKRFTAGKTMIGVGQITSLNAGELRTLKERMAAFMRGAAERNGLDMVFFMLTNILTETTELVCQGQGALQLAAKAFHLDVEDDQNPVLTLPGVVSRKKQLIPELMLAEQE